MAPRVDAHALGEERSLAMHRVIAERLASEPQLAHRAKARVREWLESGSVHASYARQWLDILERPVDELAAFLSERSEQATTLRSVSPFAGALDPRERWAIHRRVRELAEGAHAEP